MGEGSVLPQRVANSVPLVPALKKILLKGAGESEIAVQCRGAESKNKFPTLIFRIRQQWYCLYCKTTSTCHGLSVYVPGMVLSTVRGLAHLILLTILSDRYDPRFPRSRETEARGQ